jgi:hypothetical protein
VAVNAAARLIGYFMLGLQSRSCPMFQQQLVAAVAAARTFAQIDVTSRALWSAHAAGLIDDRAAQEAAEALEARKRLIGAGNAKNAPVAVSGRLRRHVPRSPDREASIRRRRSCAASGAVPNRIAADFTVAEVAVLSIIAAEVRRSGSCSWPIDRIAALSGVCRRSAQYALRRAAALGLIQIDERPRPGQRHLPHVVTVISREWRSWLKLGTNRVQNPAHHGNHTQYLLSDSLTRSSSVPCLKGSQPSTGSPCRNRSPRSHSKTPQKA